MPLLWTWEPAPPPCSVWGPGPTSSLAMVTGWSVTDRETKGVHSHIARDGPGSCAGPACGPPSDTPSPCSTSPSPNLTAPRRRGRSPSTSPTSAVTAPRAASTASSSTSPGEPCPDCPSSHGARPTSLDPHRGVPTPARHADVYSHLQPQLSFSDEPSWLLQCVQGAGVGPGVPPLAQEPGFPCFFQVKMCLAETLLPKSAPDPVS